MVRLIRSSLNLLKFSIVTATYNRADTVRQAITSIQKQAYKDVTHVVVDGASTDGTLEVVRAHLDVCDRLISEPDHGIYDALNKGLALATGDIVGVLHSDDFFADEQVLADVALAFSDPEVDVVYGDLDYVAKGNTDKVIRHWVAGPYSRARLAWGWMPPHPTLFVRRRVIEQWGGYDTSFRIAADYDAILRYFSRGGVRAAYIPRVLVKMRVGGESNRSLAKIWLKTREDYRALRKNRVGGLGALVWKNLSKVGQFF